MACSAVFTSGIWGLLSRNSCRENIYLKHPDLIMACLAI
jgi:hypothetical protein